MPKNQQRQIYLNEIGKDVNTFIRELRAACKTFTNPRICLEIEFGYYEGDAQPFLYVQEG